MCSSDLLAKAWRIDLLIVDAHMPYMTGIDFAAAVIAEIGRASCRERV